MEFTCLFFCLFPVFFLASSLFVAGHIHAMILHNSVVMQTVRLDLTGRVDLTVRSDPVVRLDLTVWLDLTVRVDLTARSDPAVRLDLTGRVDLTVRINLTVRLDFTVWLDRTVGVDRTARADPAVRLNLTVRLYLTVRADLAVRLYLTVRVFVPCTTFRSVLGHWFSSSSRSSSSSSSCCCSRFNACLSYLRHHTCATVTLEKKTVKKIPWDKWTFGDKVTYDVYVYVCIQIDVHGFYDGTHIHPTSGGRPYRVDSRSVTCIALVVHVYVDLSDRLDLTVWLDLAAGLDLID